MLRDALVDYYSTVMWLIGLGERPSKTALVGALLTFGSCATLAALIVVVFGLK